MNVSALLADLPVEGSKIATFVSGVEKVVNDAKANGGTSVLIADIEALVPEGEAVVNETEQVAKDIV